MSALNNSLREKMIKEVSEMFPNVDVDVIRELCLELRSFEDVVDRILLGGDNLSFKSKNSRSKKGPRSHHPSNLHKPRNQNDSEKESKEYYTIKTNTKQAQSKVDDSNVDTTEQQFPAVNGVTAPQTQRKTVWAQLNPVAEQAPMVGEWPSLDSISNKSQPKEENNKVEETYKEQAQIVENIQNSNDHPETTETPVQNIELGGNGEFNVVFPSFLQDVIVEYSLFFNDSEKIEEMEEEEPEEEIIESVPQQQIQQPYYPNYMYQPAPYVAQNASFPEMPTSGQAAGYGMYNNWGYYH